MEGGPCDRKPDFLEKGDGDGEVAQWLRALAALPEDQAFLWFQT